MDRKGTDEFQHKQDIASKFEHFPRLNNTRTKFPVIQSEAMSSDAFSKWRARILDPGFLIVITLGGLLRFDRLGDHDNSYYTATVASMIQTWHNFFFASFDPVGLVMVDKPPVAFWLQAIPAWCFGINSWSVTLPQVILGVSAIALLYLLLRTTFGRLSATVAGIVLAVLPVSVIIDSRNEPDALVSFGLLLAAGAIIHAAVTGKLRWLVIFGIVMGVVFNTKMLVGFIPLPSFLLYYLIVCNRPTLSIIKRVLFTLSVLTVISASWVTIVSFTPETDRPYIGSTQDNSVWTLVVKYNGVDRFTSFIGPRSSGSTTSTYTDGFLQNDRYFAGTANTDRDQRRQPVQIGAPNSATPQIDPLGLLRAPLAPQLGFLLPLALISLVLIIISSDVISKQNPRISLIRSLRISTPGSQAVLWSSWLITGLLVFGTANSTTSHPYYLVGIAIPLAATIGIGASAFFKFARTNRRVSPVLLIAPLAGFGYHIFGDSTLPDTWIVLVLVAGAAISILSIGMILAKPAEPSPLAKAGIAIGASALLVLPIITAMRAEGRITAGMPIDNRLSINRQIPAITRHPAHLTNFLQKEPRGSSQVIIATINAREAAPFIISGVPSVAIGGFSGNDPIFSLDSFKRFVREKDLQYFLTTDNRSRLRNNTSRQRSILNYIQGSWEDVSHSVGLPSQTLFRNPHIHEPSILP